MTSTSALVSDAIRRYEDLLVSDHLGTTRDAVQRTGDRVLRPYFIGKTEYEQLLEVTALVNRGLLAAADRLTRDDTLRRELGIPDYMSPLLELDREHGFPSAMARFDGLVDRAGAYQAIEYNGLPGFNEFLTLAFASLPIAADFAKRYTFRTMRLGDRFGEVVRAGESTTAGDLPVVAVPVTSLEAIPEKYPRPWCAMHTEGRLCRLVEATVDEFRHEGGRLIIGRGDGIVVDLLMPYWEDLTAWSGSSLPLLDAIRAGSVRTLGGLSRGLMASYKHTFELLTDPDHASLFEPAVAAALAKNVPWTRVVKERKTSYRGKVVDLLPFVAENRERWVLKPSGGSAGSGVLLGDKCTDAVWRRTLKRALHQHYIVQERILGAIESFPFAAPDGDGMVVEESSPSFEPFVWRGEMPADAMVRLSSTGNHTLGGGGSYSAVWIIDGEK